LNGSKLEEGLKEEFHRRATLDEELRRKVDNLGKQLDDINYPR